jgi:hypothetical protein
MYINTKVVYHSYLNQQYDGMADITIYWYRQKRDVLPYFFSNTSKCDNPNTRNGVFSSAYSTERSIGPTFGSLRAMLS